MNCANADTLAPIKKKWRWGTRAWGIGPLSFSRTIKIKDNDNDKDQRKLARKIPTRGRWGGTAGCGAGNRVFLLRLRQVSAWGEYGFPTEQFDGSSSYGDDTRVRSSVLPVRNRDDARAGRGHIGRDRRNGSRLLRRRCGQSNDQCGGCADRSEAHGHHE